MLVKLSVRQISLLLSSIWAQATSPENTPANYEAIAHTYSLLLLFSGSKVILLSMSCSFPLHEYMLVREEPDSFPLSSSPSFSCGDELAGSLRRITTRIVEIHDRHNSS